MDRPNQGLPLLTPGGGKKRDPRNKVETILDQSIKPLSINFIILKSDKETWPYGIQLPLLPYTTGLKIATDTVAFVT